MAGWRKILDQYQLLIKKLRLRPHFVLCGGEPTLAPLYFEMLNELNARWPNVETAVTTNGTALNRDRIARSRFFNVSYQISLDGPDRERHDALRGAGSFQAAINGLKNLKEAGQSANFLATLSKRSSAWIDEYFATALENEAAAMNFVRFISQGAGRRMVDSGNDRPLHPTELRSAYASIVQASSSSGVRTNTDHPLYCLIDPTLGSPGLMGFQGIVVDYKGNLKVSSRTEPTLGNILESGLEELFLQHPTMSSLREGRVEICGSCVYYTRCGGDRNAAYAETGNFLAKDPGCWLPAERTETVR